MPPRHLTHDASFDLLNEHREEACRRSATKRRAGADLRRDLHNGDVSLAEVLLDPPECIAHLPLFQVLLMGRSLGPRKLQYLNTWAMREFVNLATPLGQASQRSRQWCAKNVQVGVRLNTRADHLRLVA
jgi:hypothetical protein